MLHAHAGMPCMEPFEQDRLELKRVIGGRVRNAHHFREDQEHEEVVLVALGACDRTSVRGVIELGGQIGPTAPCLPDVVPRQRAFSSRTAPQSRTRLQRASHV